MDRHRFNNGPSQASRFNFPISRRDFIARPRGAGCDVM
jgi:hypothetical protein